MIFFMEWDFQLGHNEDKHIVCITPRYWLDIPETPVSQMLDRKTGSVRPV